MLEVFAASLRLRRASLAVGLCLLAFLFAFEAKTAWYGPPSGPSSDIRAAKALPACTPELVEHGIPSSGPAHANHPHAAFLSNAVLWSPRPNLPLGIDDVRGPFSFFAANHLPPSLLFRPPPSV